MGKFLSVATVLAPFRAVIGLVLRSLCFRTGPRPGANGHRKGVDPLLLSPPEPPATGKECSSLEGALLPFNSQVLLSRIA
jgi:hypothetical protein